MRAPSTLLVPFAMRQLSETGEEENEAEMHYEDELALTSATIAVLIILSVAVDVISECYTDRLERKAEKHGNDRHMLQYYKGYMLLWEQFKAEVTTLGFLAFIMWVFAQACLLYTSPSPRDATLSRMPSSA